MIAEAPKIEAQRSLRRVAEMAVAMGTTQNGSAQLRAWQRIAAGGDPSERGERFPNAGMRDAWLVSQGIAVLGVSEEEFAANVAASVDEGVGRYEGLISVASLLNEGKAIPGLEVG